MTHRAAVIVKYSRQYELDHWLNELAREHAGERYETRMDGARWLVEFDFFRRADAVKFRHRVVYDRPDIPISTELYGLA